LELTRKLYCEHNTVPGRHNSYCFKAETTGVVIEMDVYKIPRGSPLNGG
jgi:hypothetical protein